jgi:putative ubiquitin-RnfH superfamily antitoxin RatB of RatAB toxin-antitoxin module
VSTIRVTVVYALPDAATEIALALPAGATVADALEGSGLSCRLGRAALMKAPLGIFGQRVRLDAALSDGDRVEIYRPLEVDSKAIRRRRAAHKRR